MTTCNDLTQIVTNATCPLHSGCATAPTCLQFTLQTTQSSKVPNSKYGSIPMMSCCHLTGYYCIVQRSMAKDKQTNCRPMQKVRKTVSGYLAKVR